MKRHATAHWSGALSDGQGSLTTQSGALSDHGYSFKARFEDENGKSGTNPEELLAAAHAGCFTMQLSHLLAENGTPATDLDTKCIVTVEPKEGGGFRITRSALSLTANVPDIEPNTFDRLAEQAKTGCPMSVALGAIEITLGTQLQ